MSGSKYLGNVYGTGGCGGGGDSSCKRMFGSSHNSAFNVLMCDGSVRPVSNTINTTTWQALATVAGGEVVGDF